MKWFLLIVFITATKVSLAQNLELTAELRGSDSSILAAATVTLRTADSILVKIATSKENGTVTFSSLKAGDYLLQLEHVGYTTKWLLINSLVEKRKLGIIYLEKLNADLAEVIVTSKRPLIEVKADKTIFNVENTLNATGTNAWDLLRKAPGVVIDNNGGLIVEGKEGVQVYIDNKPSALRGADLQAYLESIQSSSIATIEIITQPSSKYEAAGNAGIINIRFRKNTELGMNGTISISGTAGKYLRGNGTVTFNYRTSKGNLYGSYGNSRGTGYSFLILNREQNELFFNARTNSKYSYGNQNYRLGYDWNLDKKNSIGILVRGNDNNSEVFNNSRTPIGELGSTKTDSVLIANNHSNSHNRYNSVNVNYHFLDSSGHDLSLDADYGLYKSDRDVFQPNQYYNGPETNLLREYITRQITPVEISLATIKIDYEQPFAKGKLALGIKISEVISNNQFDFYEWVQQKWEVDALQSNSFKYREHINAGYVNYNYKKDKWNLQAGLRIEQTKSRGELLSQQANAQRLVQRKYSNFFPSAGVSYALNQTNQFAIAYSRRIERPNYVSLNPFVYKLDELSYSRGNPFLQPQYTDNVKLSHTFKYRLTSSVSYSFVRDFFGQVTEPEAGNKNFLGPKNIANQQVVNLGISWPFNIKPWWNVYLSLNGYTSSYASKDPGFIPVKRETLSMYAQQSFNIGEAWQLELSGWYMSPSIWGGTYRTKAMGSLNLAGQYSFGQNKWVARMSLNDLLYSSPWKGTTVFQNLLIRGSGGSDSRNVTISLSYRFGNQKVKKSRSRQTGLEEERQRVGD